MRPGRTATAMTWVDDVLAFWFETLRPQDWWSAAPAIDDAVRGRFAALYATLRVDPPAPVMLDARGHVAIVIVFDQFARHLHRGEAGAFATDALAVSYATAAVRADLDQSLSRPERQFLYMPFLHAEDRSLQQRSLALFEALGDRDALRSARAHHDLVARFGRFPARNAALGRTSTAEEADFLAAAGARRRPPRSATRS